MIITVIDLTHSRISGIFVKPKQPHRIFITFISCDEINMEPINHVSNFISSVLYIVLSIISDFMFSKLHLILNFNLPNNELISSAFSLKKSYWYFKLSCIFLWVYVLNLYVCKQNNSLRRYKRPWKSKKCNARPKSMSL